MLALVALFFYSGQALATTPQIDSVSPSSGPLSGGTKVTISGNNFTANSKVYFDESQALEVYYVNNTELEVKTPPSPVSGKVDIKIVNEDGEQGVKFDAFLYNPIITEVTEDTREGSTVGGDQITIKGEGFQNDLTLYVGTNVATNVTVSSDGTTINAITPPGSTGPVKIKVVNPDGGSAVLSDTSNETFKYRLSNPVINKFEPDRGTIEGETQVTIYGDELSPDGTVYFGDSPAIIDKEASNTTKLEVTTPPSGTAGFVKVTIYNPDGESATAADEYEYIVVPQILSITPNYGSPEGGEEVTIEGNNFLALDSPVVTFGGEQADIKEKGSNDQGMSYLKVLTPAFDSIGAVDVAVYDASDIDKIDIVYRGFTYKNELSQPRIDSITPNSGSVEGGMEVTIKGQNFFSGVDVPLKVFFGEKEATQVTVKSSEEIAVVVPQSDVTGPVDVTVENSDGAQYTFSNGFNYLAPERVLLITNITPNKGTMEGGTPVTINGANFLEPDNDSSDNVTVDVSLTIGGHEVNDLKFIDSHTYEAVAPPGYGTVDVSLLITKTTKKEDGTSEIFTERAILKDGYTYVIPESNPIITGVTPSRGPKAGGTLITIEGTDFRAPKTGEEVKVYIGGVEATNVQVESSTKITAYTPASETVGLKDIVVINPDLATAIMPNAFTYVANIMTIVSVTPDKGPVSGSTLITITGANFDQDEEQYTAVEIGTETEEAREFYSATIVEITEDGTTIKALTPEHTAGIKDVVVKNRFGSVTLPGAFTYYVPSSEPQIMDIEPKSGPTTGGTPITIRGVNFQAKAKVTIGGKEAAEVEVIDVDEIRAVTPSGEPGPQDIVVHNPDGGKATLTSGFIYISHPEIKSINPDRGSVNGGDIVTIKGNDFYPGMQIFFGTDLSIKYETVSEGVYQQVPKGDYEQVLDGDIFVVDPQTVKLRLPAWNETVPEEGLKVDVAIINSDSQYSQDGGSVIAPEIFTYREPVFKPIIEDITPNFGPAEGKNEVLITGTDFQPDAKVYFGWEEAKVLEVTPNLIRVSAPANSPGFYDVTVVNVNDTSTVTKEDAYEYRQPLTSPRITGAFPAYGPAAGGILLKITGQYFWPGVKVFIGTKEAHLYVDENGYIVAPEFDNEGNLIPPENGKEIDPLVTSSGEVIYVHTPPGPKAGETYVPGPVDIYIVNPDGGSANLREGFTYKVPDSDPVITKIDPIIGTTKGGTPVTITGEDFREELEVYFDGIKVEVTKVTPTEVKVITPAHEPGFVDITLVNKDSGIAAFYRAFEYRVPASQPEIESIEPDIGSIMGGTPVVIKGDDFRKGEDGSVPKVYFDGTEATDVQYIDYKTLTCVTPPGEAGKADVTVANPDLGSFTLRQGFTYQSSVPKIEAVVPNRATREGGIQVVIRGSDFISTPESVLEVYFGTEPGTETAVNAEGTMIKTILPPAKDGRLGAVDVKVINGDGVEVVLKDGFTYVVPDSQPVVESIDPNEGSTNGGNWATIKGQDFRKDPEVFIGGQPAQTVKLIDSNTIRIKLPPHTEGAKDVMVVNYDGGTGILPAGYIYKIPESEPIIEKIEPNRGPQVGGTSITVTGLDFREGVELYIGGALAEDIKRVDYATITAETPPGSVGPADVTVVNPDRGTYTLSKGFTYYFVETPTINSVEPNEGPATGGTEITISGSKFKRDTKVYVGDALADNIEVVSDILIKATTPPGDVGWQEVKVVNLDGGWSSLEEGFKYLRPRGVPDTPTGFYAKLVDPETLKLKWNPSEFANYYEIWVSGGRYRDYRFLARTSDTIYYTDSLLEDAGHYFKVRAVNEFGCSGFSDEYYARVEEDDDDDYPERDDVQTKTTHGIAETTINDSRVLSRHYNLDFSSSEYRNTRKFIVRVDAEAVDYARGGLTLHLNDLSLGVPVNVLKDIYKDTIGYNQKDSWVEVIIEDLGQKEAESLLKYLPRSSEIVSHVWSVKFQGRIGRHTYPDSVLPVGTMLNFSNVSGTVTSPVVYCFNAFTHTWEQADSYYTPTAVEVRIPGKYVLVDSGGR
ncbi:MAG: large repetitive protein [Clostridia bacterium]|nr:large repetitive protein [Clostridia bacterium]